MAALLLDHPSIGRAFRQLTNEKIEHVINTNNKHSVDLRWKVGVTETWFKEGLPKKERKELKERKKEHEQVRLYPTQAKRLSKALLIYEKKLGTSKSLYIIQPWWLSGLRR